MNEVYTLLYIDCEDRMLEYVRVFNDKKSAVDAFIGKYNTLGENGYGVEDEHLDFDSGNTYAIFEMDKYLFLRKIEVE